MSTARDTRALFESLVADATMAASSHNTQRPPLARRAGLLDSVQRARGETVARRALVADVRQPKDATRVELVIQAPASARVKE